MGDDGTERSTLDIREAMAADFARTGLTTGAHPVAFLRPGIDRTGALRAADLPAVADGRRVRVAGMVIVRQRPYTAKGMYFATLEDQMTDYDAKTANYSPDRMDALVYALTDLMVEPVNGQGYIDLYHRIAEEYREKKRQPATTN